MNLLSTNVLYQDKELWNYSTFMVDARTRQMLLKDVPKPTNENLEENSSFIRWNKSSDDKILWS